MHDDQEKARQDWRIPEALWERIEPLLPARKPHPLGCHRPRVDDRKAMECHFFRAPYRLPVAGLERDGHVFE